MRGAGEIEAPPSTGHRHVEKPTLFCDHVLAAADKRLEHGRRQLEPRRARRLRQTPFDERRHEHRLELEALGLMDRHHLDRVG